MKEKLFDVLAGLMTLPEFETWLYNDFQIQSSILEDDNVLRLCSIDLSSKHALHELKKFCFDLYDEEEFYVQDIEVNANLIIEAVNEKEVVRYVRNICAYSDWGDGKHLFYDLFCLEDAYGEFEYSGYRTGSEIIVEMKSHARVILKAFEDADLCQKKKIVFQGLRRDRFVPQWTEPKPQKRWYQFWN